jgi:hypothetical protein
LLVSKPLAARKPLQQGSQGQQQQLGSSNQAQGVEQCQALQQQQSGTKVNPFFMSIQDKKKLKQQQVSIMGVHPFVRPQLCSCGEQYRDPLSSSSAAAVST